MKEINQYILEKLRINKNSNIDNFLNNLEEEIINYLTGKLNYEYKKDYTFEIKDPIEGETDSSIINMIYINLLSKKILPSLGRNLAIFSSKIVVHLNQIFKDKEFTYHHDYKLKKITIFIRIKEN